MARDLFSGPHFTRTFIYSIRNDLAEASFAVRPHCQPCCSGVSMTIIRHDIAITFKVSILDVWRPMVDSIFAVSLPKTGITIISPRIGVC